VSSLVSLVFSSGALTLLYFALVAMLINEYIYEGIKYINKNRSLPLFVLLALLPSHWLRTVVQEVH
jgi:hypothetical protein